MEVVDMYLTIQKVISQFGVEIIQSKRFVFLLDDYCAFNNEPKPIKKILKDMADLGFIVELYRIGEWNAHCYSLCQRYIDTTGVREDYTKHVFKALAKGFGWNLHSIKDEKENNFGSPKSLPRLSVDKTVLSSNKNIELNHLDYISRNAVNTSKFDCIKYFQVSSKGDYPHNELRISFLLLDLSPYHTYAFYYCLINSSGIILEKDTISLKPSSKTLRCIESVGCGLLLTDITRIEYGIILEGIVAQFNYSQSKPVDSSRIRLHRSITDKDLTKISVWRSDLDSFGRNKSIYDFQVRKVYDYLEFSFRIKSFSKRTRYKFCYVIIDQNSHIMEEDSIKLKPDERETKIITECASKCNHCNIMKIEYYLKEYTI